MPNVYLNRTFTQSCNKDLLEQSQLGLIDGDTYKKATVIINRDAEESKHMKVSDFVDMCISLARIK